MSQPTLYNFCNSTAATRKPKVKPPLKTYTKEEYEELKKSQKEVQKAFVKKKIK